MNIFCVSLENVSSHHKTKGIGPLRKFITTQSNIKTALDLTGLHGTRGYRQQKVIS